MSNTTPAAQAALAELMRIKAPTKRAARTAALLLELPTQADVEAFTAQLRREARVQDVTLLPATTWRARKVGQAHGTGELYSTGILLNTLESSEDVSISWPSVYSHWGVMVSFTWGGERMVAHSADYHLTETYLSA